MMRTPDRKGKPKAPPPGSAEDLSDWGDNEDDNTLSSLSIQDVVESPPRTAGVFSGKSVIDGGAEGGFGVFGEDFGKEDEDDEDEVKVPIQLVNLTKRTLCCAAFGIDFLRFHTAAQAHDIAQVDVRAVLARQRQQPAGVAHPVG